MKWEFWLELYLGKHCTARGLMPKTIAAYQMTLQGFRAYVRFRIGRPRSRRAHLTRHP